MTIGDNSKAGKPSLHRLTRRNDVMVIVIVIERAGVVWAETDDWLNKRGRWLKIFGVAVRVD